MNWWNWVAPRRRRAEVAGAARVAALVLAGGEGTRLRPLTVEHAKPALPFVRGYRIIDFVISNLVNSDISPIYLIAQYRPESLVRHIESIWMPVAREREFSLEVVLPRPEGGEFKGTADAVHQNLERVLRHEPDAVAVFAGDHIYRMDVRQMVEYHRERGADVTVAAIPVPIDQAPSFGVIAAQAGGRIREFQEKPAIPRPIAADPSRAYASMGNYVFEPRALERLLEDARRRGGTDFGHHVFSAMPPGLRAYAYDFGTNRVPGVRSYEEPAYWRDVGTLDALKAAQEDVQGAHPRFNLHNDAWPLCGESHRPLR